MNDLLVAGCSFVAGGFTTAWALLVLSLANRAPAKPADREQQR